MTEHSSGGPGARVLALLAGLLLAVGCAGSSDPEEPSASTPAVSQGLSSAPAGPSRRAFAGPGLAWTRKLGASALDYPGPAALVASPESGLPLRLSLLPSDTPSGWCTAPGGSSAWQGAASTLRFGGDAACSPQRPDACRQAVDGLLDSGAALVALRPGRAGLELSGFQQEQLAALRLAAEARGQTLHLAASSRAELGAEGLLDSLELADLVLWEGDALELARSGRLGLANRVLRSAGRRGMLSLELSEQLPDESSLVAALGLHLATGGVAWLDAVAGAPRVERSLRWAAQNPEYFERSVGTVGLVISGAALEGPDGAAHAQSLLGAARLFASLSLPVEPVLLKDAEVLVDVDRAAGLGLIAVVDGSGLSDGQWESLHGRGEGTVLLLQEGEARPAPAAGIEVRSVGARGTLAGIGEGEELSALRRLVERLDGEDQALLDRARLTAGSLAETDLPLDLLFLPTRSPERGLLVQHLVDQAALRGRPGTRLRSSGHEVLFPVPYSLGGFPCLAALHEPGVEEPLELPCSPVAGEALVRVSLPGGLELSPWSVLTLRSRPSDRSDQFGVKPIRLLGEGTTPWSPPVVGFEVPFLDPAQALAVSLPEFVQAASAPSEFDGQPSGWVGSATVSPDGRSGRFEATSPSLGLVVDVRTGLDRVDLEMSLTNRSESSLGGVVAILCASSRGASPFPESGHARTWVVSESGPARLDALPNDEGDPLYVYREDISEPLTVLRSMDGAWVLGHGFEESMASGGNASSNGVCVHSRPDFGSLEPGQTVRRSGFLYLGPESGLSSSWQTPPEGPAAGLQLDAKVGPCLTN